MKSETGPTHPSGPVSNGYRSEIADISRALADPLMHGALVIGASGMGKSTVISAAVSALDSGVPVHRFRGANLLASRDLGIFEIMLSRVGVKTDELSPGAALSIVRRVFEQAQTERTAVVMIDNADRVDELSLAILAQLAAAGRIKVVAAAETIRPPVDLLSALWAGGQMIRTDLEGIDDDAVAAMAREAGYELDAHTILEDREKSQSNPRMLKNLIVGRATTIGARRGAEDRALWNVLPLQRHVLELTAMARSLPYDWLVTVCDPEALDALAERGIILITKGKIAEVSIVEAAVAETLRNSIQPAQSLQLWKELESGRDIRTATGRALFGLVKWGQSLGFPQDPETILGAGLWANGRGEFSAAAELLRESHQDVPEIKLELARSERGRGNGAEAERIVDSLISDPAVRENSDRYLSRLACLELRLTDPRTPHDLRSDWIRSRLHHPLDIGRLDVTRGYFEAAAGRFTAARKLAERVYRDYACATRHRQRACALLGMLDVLCGRIEVGLEYLSLAETMLDLPDITSFEVEDSVPLIFAGRYLAGEWDTARGSLERLTPLPTEASTLTALVDLSTGHITRAWQVLGRELSLRADTDRVELANSAFRLAEGMLQMRDASTRRSSRSAEPRSGDWKRSHSVSLGGFSDEATPVRAGDSGPAGATTCTGNADYSWLRDSLSELLGLQAQALKDPSKAVDGLHRLGTDASGRGAHSLAVYAWMEASRHGNSAAAACLTGSAGKVDGALGRFGAAIADVFPGDRVEALIFAAEEALSFGAVVMSADLARMARERAIRQRNPGAVKQARVVLDSSMRAITFDTGGAKLTEMLTPVEKQLVDGVAADTSNSDLSMQLQLSVRTIEWHLGRLYRRLHVSDRQELKQIARNLS